MSEKATFRKTSLPPQPTNEFNDFVFSIDSTPPARLKSNAKQCYPCKFCDLQFSCKTTLSQHILTHECDSLCKSEKELHLKSVKRPSAYQEYNLSSGQESNFQKHCLIHNSKRSFVCKICNESFPLASNLQKHCLLKHAQEPTSCVEESELVDDHISVQPLESLLISTEPFLCDKNSVKNTDSHKLTFTYSKQNPFVCNVRKKDYNDHGKTHDNITAPKNKNFVCEVCQKKFSAKRLLTRHLKRHFDSCVTGDKDFNVERMVEDFKNKTGFKKFNDKTQYKDAAQGEDFKEKVRHKDSNNKPGDDEFKDKPGNKDSTNKAGCKDKPKRKSPKNKVVGEEFTCDVCNKRYKLKIAFMSHQMSHMSAKPTCEVCHKQCASNKLLKLHFRRHSDARFFFCEVCNKGFKHKHHLRAHFITHTDELPFVCEVCNKGYKHRWGLKQHKHLHAKELPFVCKVCGKAFEQECNLNAHFSLHTRETSEAEDCDRGIKIVTAKEEPKQNIAIGSC